jgi:hypothetical protein
MQIKRNEKEKNPTGLYKKGCNCSMHMLHHSGTEPRILQGNVYVIRCQRVDVLKKLFIFNVLILEALSSSWSCAFIYIKLSLCTS